MAKAGTTLVLAPASWPKEHILQWRVLSAARAIENGICICAVNMAGTYKDVVLGGHSRFIDPLGHVLAEAGEGEEICYAEYDEEKYKDLGKRLSVVSGVVITILVAIITFGGLKSISKTASKIVPAMAVVYFIVTVIFLGLNAGELPHAIALVIDGAFNGTAAAGGFAGAGVMLVLRSGIARGLYSNESGLGSAPIVAAAAKTKWPAEQGLISMTGTFIDTIIICTMTGLTIIVSGQWLGELNGAELTQAAFATTYGVFAPFLLTISLTLFAFTTIIGWNYYGERCWEYLFGTKTIPVYRVCYIAVLASAVFLKLEAIWALADIVNGLMAIPNLIALLGLSGVIVSETKKYFGHLEIRDARLAAYKERRIGKKAEV